ncbi:hypothetical protein C0992_009200 [Termitomyces sp. T32_za158]|nr:hypothetical protein C0992_009200 [Termitomyces sp. T32_za158]
MAYALSSILVGLFDVKHYFHLQLVPHLSRHHQYWRLPLHHLAFSSSSDLFIAQLVLFSAAVHVERRFGSLKFAVGPPPITMTPTNRPQSFTLVSTALASLLELASLILFHPAGLNTIPTGPTALVFSILYQYSRIVPATYTYRVFGLPLNNKSLLYLLAAQTALSRPPGSLAIAAIGILAGSIYRSDLATLKSYRLPPLVVHLATRFLLPLVGALRPPRRSNRALPDDVRARASTAGEGEGEGEEVVTTARPAPPAPSDTNNDNDSPAAAPSGSVMREWVDELTRAVPVPGIRVPSEDEIRQLTTMFPDVQRDVVVAALQRSASIEGAVETLLSSQR